MCEKLGSIELGYACRFYEMENKEIEDEHCELVKVSQFYLDWCRQKICKYRDSREHH